MRRLWFLVFAACQGASSAPPAQAAARATIEVRDAQGTLTAKITPGHPCRVALDGIDMQIGGRPLVAMHGSSRWTGEDAANGTTFRKNDEIVARIHAKQLFDDEGIPLLRVMDNGDIVDPTGRIARKATLIPAPGPGSTPEIAVTNAAGRRDFTLTGLTGTPDDLALAAMVTATSVPSELRALAVCHYLLGLSH